MTGCPFWLLVPVSPPRVFYAQASRVLLSHDRVPSATNLCLHVTLYNASQNRVGILLRRLLWQSVSSFYIDACSCTYYMLTKSPFDMFAVFRVLLIS